MIGAVIAMQCEADILLKNMTVKRTLTVSGKPVYEGKAFGKDLILIVTGVGKVNAAIGAQIAANMNATRLLNFGVAGGLNENTELCKVYEVEAAVQFDFDLTQLNGTKIGTLDEYEENFLPLSVTGGAWRKIKLGTADRFNDSTEDYKLLTEELQADVRDMEGAAIVQTALAAKLPMYAFKAISDVAGSGSTTEQYLKNRGRALENLQAALPEIFQLI